MKPEGFREGRRAMLSCPVGLASSSRARRWGVVAAGRLLGALLRVATLAYDDEHPRVSARQVPLPTAARRIRVERRLPLVPELVITGVCARGELLG